MGKEPRYNVISLCILFLYIQSNKFHRFSSALCLSLSFSVLSPCFSFPVYPQVCPLHFTFHSTLSCFLLLYKKVYKGRKKKTIEYVAVKSVDKSLKEKIMREVSVMFNLDHPHVLKFVNWYMCRLSFSCSFFFLLSYDLQHSMLYFTIYIYFLLVLCVFSNKCLIKATINM